MRVCLSVSKNLCLLFWSNFQSRQHHISPLFRLVQFRYDLIHSIHACCHFCSVTSQFIILSITLVLLFFSIFFLLSRIVLRYMSCCPCRPKIMISRPPPAFLNTVSSYTVSWYLISFCLNLSYDIMSPSIALNSMLSYAMWFPPVSLYPVMSYAMWFPPVSLPGDVLCPSCLSPR